MSRHLLKEPAVQEELMNVARTADDTDLYNALNEAVGAVEIGTNVHWQIPSSYRLIRVDERLRQHRGEIEIALVNDRRCAVVYYVKLTIAEPRHGVAVQNLIWRSSDVDHDAVLISASQKAIFGYILKQYDLVLSDDPKTGQGRCLWMRHVSKALAEGSLVYYASISGARFEPVTTQDQLKDLQGRWRTITDDESCHLALNSRTPRPAHLLLIPKEVIEVVDGPTSSV